ncbi:MAG: hypothetical protein EOO38_18195, partial [Cytophagaceae bacterium]
MRFVFIDEAGTSEHEPVTVVVGVIVDADRQMTLAEAAANEVLNGVPSQFKDGFQFHAEEVFGNSKKYGPLWSIADRVYFLQKMMEIPRKLVLGLSFAIARRDAVDDISKHCPPGLYPYQFQHVIAFQDCIARADKF